MPDMSSSPISQKTSTAQMCDLRIVLLGKTGSGKSSTGNTILGRDAFRVKHFPVSATERCEKQEGNVEGRKISVTDTPGIFHTNLTEGKLRSEIMECLNLSAPGPHVFLLVIKLGRYTEEERDTAKWILKNFGEDIIRHTIVLFTGSDKLEKPIHEFVQENKALKEFLDKCEGYHAFKNVGKRDEAQVTELMKKIEEVKNNRQEHYKAQDKIKKREKISHTTVLLILCVFAFLLIFYMSYQQTDNPSSLIHKAQTESPQWLTKLIHRRNAIATCKRLSWRTVALYSHHQKTTKIKQTNKHNETDKDISQIKGGAEDGEEY